MRPVFPALLWLVAGGASAAQAQARERIVESIVPWLASNSSCWSEVELQNLGNREVDAEVEAHKSSGALAPLTGRAGIQVHLGAGERARYKLRLTEETTGAWVRVRETVPLPQLSAVVAVSGFTECLVSKSPGAGESHSTVREVVWPTSNPWFSGEVSREDSGVLALINASERPARISGCYSAGVLYSVPRDDGAPAQFTPVCSAMIDEMVPPFGSRQFPVARDGNLHFTLTSRGDAIVMQMLRPTESGIQMYKVDSTITFGNELPAK